MKSEATHSCLISVLLPKRLGLKLKIIKFCQNKNLHNLQVFLKSGVFCLLVNCSPLACSVGTHLQYYLSKFNSYRQKVGISSKFLLRSASPTKVKPCLR